MNKTEIERILRDYHWMVREISRLRSYLDDAGERTIGQYGIDAGQPKPRGGTSDPVHMEVVRRERQWKRIEKMEKKVRYVQERIESVDDERERTVLDCMLDGMNIVAIARHMGISERYVYIIRDRIVSNMLNAGSADFAGFAGKMQKQSLCV